MAEAIVLFDSGGHFHDYIVVINTSDITPNNPPIWTDWATAGLTALIAPCLEGDPQGELHRTARCHLHLLWSSSPLCRHAMMDWLFPCLSSRSPLCPEPPAWSQCFSEGATVAAATPSPSPSSSPSPKPSTGKWMRRRRRRGRWFGQRLIESGVMR